MGFFRKIVKNVLPYYFVKKYQARGGGGAFGPGGYYSPIPAMEDIKNHNFQTDLPEKIDGINLNSKEQLGLLDSFETFYKELPFADEKKEGSRFYFGNDFFSGADAVFLYCMIRNLRPKKIIEAGSGFSSGVTLDTNEKFFGNSIDCAFIEPYPQRLKSLLKNNDKGKVTIHEKKLQEITPDVFGELKENDIFFIDSTHVSKFNSDVNYIIHTVLPKLAKGVYIHFHDIFYPFEYPREWLLEGRAWNEDYILRAFMEYNSGFKIVLFNNYLGKMYKEVLITRFPLAYKGIGGSIWIKKIE
jgi:hypothetical protein